MKHKPSDWMILAWLGHRGGSLTIGNLATAILVLALLYVARPVFVPLSISLFVIALVWPMQVALKLRLPKLLARLVTLNVTILVIVTGGFTDRLGIGGQWLFLNSGRLSDDLRRLDQL